MKLENIKEYVAQEKLKIKEKNDADKAKGYTTKHITIVQVGDAEASNRYVRNKIKDCQEVGIAANLMKLDPNGLCSFAYQSYCDAINGPLIAQLPLPERLQPPKIKPHFDVDGFGCESEHTPCTPGGIIDYLDYCGFKYEGKLAVVIGRSEIVGKPMAKLLLERNCTTAVVHSKTPEETKKNLLAAADLVVCAVGKAGFLDPADCPHAIIVDVGINFDENGKLVGDVIPTAPERTTPVPGGVGLLTRLKLLKNVMDCYE